MAEVRDIYRFLDEIAPFDTQEDFDNAGFLVGRGDREVKKVLVALDVTGWVVEEAVRLGITDGKDPAALIPRYQAAIMALRAIKR